MQIVCQNVYSPCLMAWEENSHICLRNVVSVLTGDLSSTYVRVLQYFRESIGKMADTVAVKIWVFIDNTNFPARKIMQKWISLTFLYLIMLNWTLKIILCQPNEMVFKVKMLLLYCLYSYRKPWRAEAGRTYIHKRRNCTLWFWHSENFATSSVRQKQSNGNASWGVLYTAHEASDVFCIRW